MRRPPATGVPFEEVVEQIDIGGPSMIRSAAKNHAFVAVITDPLDYGWVRQELESNQCSLGAKTRLVLAQKAFGCTAAYDGAIAAYLSGRLRDPIVAKGLSAEPVAWRWTSWLWRSCATFATERILISAERFIAPPGRRKAESPGRRCCTGRS